MRDGRWSYAAPCFARRVGCDVPARDVPDSLRPRPGEGAMTVPRERGVVAPFPNREVAIITWARWRRRCAEGRRWWSRARPAAWWA